ncbi:MAG: dienelactone hydrolase family protein [Gemmatimonadetes bacterium]|nr:dienelactone hydrolase family protein [Gemmatimonadota bacterium]
MSTLPPASRAGTAHHLRRLLHVPTLLVLLGAVACSGSSRDRQSTSAMTGGAKTAAMGGPRVPREPTAADQLPAAILGKAGPLQGINVEYVTGDTLTVGYLAVPAGEGPFPALIIIHEWNGLVDRVRQVADALAAEGYVALAADLYSGRTGSSPEENRALVGEVMADQPRMIANLDSAVAYLKRHPDVSGRIGAMGWCFGGGVALSFGLDGVNHDATAIFYGQLLDDPVKLAHISHEVYGTFAALDRSIPPSVVERFVAALHEAGVPNDVHVYDDVNHGFWLHVDQDPERRSKAALDAWQRLKAYLSRTLGG